MPKAWVALATAVVACGEAEKDPFAQGVWNVKITRTHEHPNYACDGTVDMKGAGATFACSAESFPDWTVSGPLEQFRLPDTLRFYVRATGSRGVQPDIAIDLEEYADHLLGWATVVLPDGTGAGHFGAVAEAWLSAD